MAQPEPAAYFINLVERLVDGSQPSTATSLPWQRPGRVYGDPRLVPQRLGQRAFQAVVLDAYSQRCATTGAKIRRILAGKTIS